MIFNIMSILALKLFLGKAWAFLKNYWWIPVGAIAFIVLLVLLRKKPESLGNALKNALESHKKEVDSLEKIHAEEIEKREVALEEFHDKVEKVEKKFKESNIELDKKKKKEIAKRVKESEEHPEKLAKDIADTWGFEIK